MPGTGGFIGKARLEGGAGHGAVIFPAAGQDGTLHEQAADAHQKLNISSNRTQRDKPFPELRDLVVITTRLRGVYNGAARSPSRPRAPQGAKAKLAERAPGA